MTDHGNRPILVHTEVPEALSGCGIGGRLVHAAFDRASATCEILVPWSFYARKWLTDRPDLSGRVGIDWDLPPATAAVVGHGRIQLHTAGSEGAAGE